MNRQVETVEALPAFSEISGSTCTYGEMDFGDELVMIGIVPPEYTDVSFAANVHALTESKIQTYGEWLAVLSKTVARGINNPKQRYAVLETVSWENNDPDAGTFSK